MNTDQIINNLLDLAKTLKKSDFSFNTADLPPRNQDYTIQFVLRDAGRLWDYNKDPHLMLSPEAGIRHTGFWAMGEEDGEYYALLEDTYKQKSKNHPKPSPAVWINDVPLCGILVDENGDRIITEHGYLKQPN